MGCPTGIVIPAYEPDISLLLSYVDRLDRVVDPARIHVEIDDPESMETVERIRESPATVNSSPTRRGKGAAVSDGFDRLGTERLAFVDADGSTPAKSVVALLDALERGTICVGSRRHPDARVVSNQSPLRRSLGDAFAWTARRVLDVALYDYQCGAKAMDQTTWRTVRDHITASGFAWDIELVAFADALGIDVTEVPVDWEDHPDSTVDPLSATVELGLTLVKVRHRARRLDESDRPYSREDPAGSTLPNEPQ